MGVDRVSITLTHTVFNHHSESKIGYESVSLSDPSSSSRLPSPVEVDQSFGALLMMCGLCTEPCHGEHCSTGAVRRRRPGEAKGLFRSGVNGAVRGL